MLLSAIRIWRLSNDCLYLLFILNIDRSNFEAIFPSSVSHFQEAAVFSSKDFVLK